jgi:hypothetical protein
MEEETKPEETVINPEDVVADDLFKEYVKNNLEAYLKPRLSRPAPGEGLKYRRDWYDRIGPETLTPEFFIAHISDVWNMKSNLHRELREIILYICNNALKQTLIDYQTQNQTKPEENENTSNTAQGPE